MPTDITNSYGTPADQTSLGPMDQGADKNISKSTEETEVANAFMQTFFQGHTPDLACINSLCNLTAKDYNCLNALEALYGIIIEGLSNDFSDHGAMIGAKVLADIITYVRQTPAGRETDSLLLELNLTGKKELLSRYNNLLKHQNFEAKNKKNVLKIIIPSRVTVGADVVIGSVLAQRLACIFPAAEVIFAGPSHISQIFHGFSNLRHLEVEYNRHGTLTDRIAGWPSLYKPAQREFAGLPPEATLVVDPDSRLTQLGLFPLTAVPNRNCFFPSRNYVSNQKHASLSKIANLWCDRFFHKDQHIWPKVSFPSSNCESAKRLADNLKSSFFLAISFGVGNNNKKRIPDPFEKSLILSLLEMKNTVILLDSGTQESGLKMVEIILAACRDRGHNTVFLHEDEMDSTPINFPHGVIGYRGSIGALGAIIKYADGFFGYDSCCQHIASALNTPAVIAFAGAPNKRFLGRWQSRGEAGRTCTIPVHSAQSLTLKKIDSLVNLISDKFQKIRRNGITREREVI